MGMFVFFGTCFTTPWDWPNAVLEFTQVHYWYYKLQKYYWHVFQ